MSIPRARAEKLINDGAQLLVGAFDSGHTTAIAQVAEQKGIPLVINIAASPAITEQGYKFVFRNFPTAPMILNDAFANQKEVFAVAGLEARTRQKHANLQRTALGSHDGRCGKGNSSCGGACKHVTAVG